MNALYDEESWFKYKAEKIRKLCLLTNTKHENNSLNNKLIENNSMKLANVMKQLQYEYQDYKYTVYRCSAKVVTLQKLFFTSRIPYKLVLAIMQRHNMCGDDANLMIPPFQLTSLIHDIFYACQQLGHFSKTPAYSLELATSMLANFLWNIFDPHRRHSISLMEIKITFILLCKLYVTDQLIDEIFTVVHTVKTRCVNKLNFEYLLNILIKFFDYIGEGAAYGMENVPLVLEQCFSRCHNSQLGLTDYQFQCLWSSSQTRFLIYANLVILIKRMEDTERLVHNNSCNACNVNKIIGIRFKCQTCKDLSLCLQCFIKGFENSKHLSSHRMIETFNDDLPRKKASRYFANLCAKFCFKDFGQESVAFCNTHDNFSINNTELFTLTTNSNTNSVTSKEICKDNKDTYNIERSTALLSEKMKTSETNANYKSFPNDNSSLNYLTTTTMNALNVSERLQTVIDKLLLQNLKLEQQLKSINTASSEDITKFLRAHQMFLIDIINEMRNISRNSSEKNRLKYPTASTPYRTNIITKNINQDLINEAEVNFLNTIGCVDSYIAVSHQGKPQDSQDQLTHSINGADINRSYLEANKSDYSIKDISCWFLPKTKSSLLPTRLNGIPENSLLEGSPVSHRTADTDLKWSHIETNMSNFHLLLHKVKEIVNDSYSENSELVAATQNLENVLDSITQGSEC